MASFSIAANQFEGIIRLDIETVYLHLNSRIEKALVCLFLHISRERM
jgi:hypothetical protein